MSPQIDPSARMSRVEFMIEMLNMWEESLQIIRRNPSGTAEEFGTEKELEAAIYVLKRTFPVWELLGEEAYTRLKNTVNSSIQIQERYDRMVTAIDNELTLEEDKVQQRQHMKDWRERSLTELDDESSR